MLKLDTKHKRKSFALTLFLHIVLIFLLFYLSLNYLEEPEDAGIAVNFGTTNVGSGSKQPVKPVRTAPKTSVPETTTSPSETTEEVSEIAEEVISQEIEDAPVISKKPKKIAEPNKKKEEKETSPESKQSKVEEKPIKKVEEKKPDPKPDKSTLDILNSFANGPKTDGTEDGGEGTDKIAGDKGDPKGDPYANSYYGQPGLGGTGGVGYGLNGRGRPTNSKVVQQCNEAGRVVVKIVVNRSGKVIQATPGVKGTTNRAQCLLDPAKKTALTFKWKADPNAPEKQIGFVEVTFGLGE